MRRGQSLQDVVAPKAVAVEVVEAPATAVPSVPDGGWGWVVVFASFMIHVILDGITYTFGIFYIEFLRYFRENKGTTAWVASIMVGVTFCIGPIASALTNRYGCRTITIAGSLLAAFGLVISLFMPSVIYLYLTIGLCTGAGFGLMYLPAIVCVTCYFEKRRSFATGLAVCGSGIGTFALAPLVETLVVEYGWKGAMLIVAGLVINSCVFGALFRPLDPPPSPPLPPALVVPDAILDRKARALSLPIDGEFYQLSLVHAEKLAVRMGSPEKGTFTYGSLQALAPIVVATTPPPEKIDHAQSRPLWRDMMDSMAEMFDLALLKDPVFLMFGLSNFLTNIGFNVPYVYIKDRAIEMGLEHPSLLLSVIGIANTAGRVVLGFISDRPSINRLWLYNSCLTLCGITTALSSYCVSFPLMAGYAATFGITAGAYVGLTSVILVDLLGLERITSSFGLLLVFEGVACLIGPPVTGWLFDITGSYDPGFYVSGTMIALSGLMLFLIPWVQSHGAATPATSNK